MKIMRRTYQKHLRVSGFLKKKRNLDAVGIKRLPTVAMLLLKKFSMSSLQAVLGGAYPSDYSDCDDSSLSTMQQEMDIARGGHFDSVPTMPFIIIMIKLVIIVAKGLNWTEYVV